MDLIKLSPNHRRSVTSSLTIVEKSLIELENMLNNPVNGFLSEIAFDISDSRKNECLQNIALVRKKIGQLFCKYGLYTHTTLVSRLINAHKSSIWEILSDTSAKKLKGYGEFPTESTKEFDNDIDILQNMIRKI